MTTTATLPAPEKAHVGRGFPALRCLHCGNDGDVSLHLSDLDSFTCHSCDASFSCEEVRDSIGHWLTVLDWIQLAPRRT